MKAALYIVATPIGNLEDLSARAIKTLREVDLIAAEDTRRAGQLLAHLDIGKKQLISYHDHVEKHKAAPLIERLIEENLTMALISDAGTPCVSDPGYRLVAEAKRRQIPVHPIPGPSALTALVSAAGLPSDQFLFVGFLPHKQKALRDEIRRWAALNVSVVFYESTRRLVETLQVVLEELPNAEVAIGRELTKIHEEIVTLPVESALHWAEQHSTLKGEAAVMVAPHATPSQTSEETIRAMARQGFAEGLSLKDLLKQLGDSGMGRSELYQLLLSVKEEINDDLE